MPLGLNDVPSTFQRVISNLLSDLLGNFVKVYLDGIIIYNVGIKKHLYYLGIALA